MRSTSILLVLAAINVTPLGAQTARRKRAAAVRSELARRADSLGALNPIREAERAVKRGDIRLVAVRGYSLELPGTPPGDVGLLRDMHGVREIEGTSDVLIGPDAIRLQHVALAYATRYNQTVRTLFRRRSSLP